MCVLPCQCGKNFLYLAQAIEERKPGFCFGPSRKGEKHTMLTKRLPILLVALAASGTAFAAEPPPGLQIRTTRPGANVTFERSLADGKALVSVVDAKQEPVLGMTDKDFAVTRAGRGREGHLGRADLQERRGPAPRRAGARQLVLDGAAQGDREAARGSRRGAEDTSGRSTTCASSSSRTRDGEDGRPRPARGNLPVEQAVRAGGVRGQGLQEGQQHRHHRSLRGHGRRPRAHQGNAGRRPAVPRGLLRRRGHQQRVQGRRRQPGRAGSPEPPRVCDRLHAGPEDRRLPGELREPEPRSGPESRDGGRSPDALPAVRLEDGRPSTSSSYAFAPVAGPTAKPTEPPPTADSGRRPLRLRRRPLRPPRPRRQPPRPRRLRRRTPPRLRRPRRRAATGGCGFSC